MPKKKERIIQEIDMTKAESFSLGATVEERLPALDIINEKFIRNFRIALTTLLRDVVTITLEDSSTMAYEDWLRTKAPNLYLNVVRMNPHGNAIICFDNVLSYGLVEVLLGGVGAEIKGMQKELTNTELTILKDITNQCIVAWDQAWRSIHQINTTFVRTETNPQFVGLVPPTNKVKVITFMVDFRGIMGDFSIVLPYNILTPLRDKM